jgi:hypothetical protein
MHSVLIFANLVHFGDGIWLVFPILFKNVGKSINRSICIVLLYTMVKCLLSFLFECMLTELPLKKMA